MWGKEKGSTVHPNFFPSKERKKERKKKEEMKEKEEGRKEERRDRSSKAIILVFVHKRSGLK